MKESSGKNAGTRNRYASYLTRNLRAHLAGSSPDALRSLILHLRAQGLLVSEIAAKLYNTEQTDVALERVNSVLSAAPRRLRHRGGVDTTEKQSWLG